jgi:hypothetical protein
VQKIPALYLTWSGSMGDREIPETYLNSAFKNTSETDIFPHGTKFLLTSVNGEFSMEYVRYQKTLV